MSAALQERPEIKIKLTVVKGPHVGQVFQLSKNGFTIGRGPENDVVLMNDPQVSRKHAQISLVENEVEILNLSQKNAVIVDGSSVQKWKLVNNSVFVVGDSEFKIEYDLGQAVISVPTEKIADVVPIKPKNNVAVPPKKSENSAKQKAQSQVKKERSPNQVPATKSNQMMRAQQSMPPMQGGPQAVGAYNPAMMPPQGNFGAQYQLQQPQTANQNTQNDSLMASPYFKIILILLIAIGAGYSYISKPDKKTIAKKIASTLKYEDEINNQLASKKQQEIEEDREERLKQLNSPRNIRINESFLRGMRDFQLGNYSRAQEFFQIVLNLDPGHALAKRHLYLSKVRFDEIVQEKLMLGDAYFKKHNFRMCHSMYTQVMHMLEGKNNDQKYLLAEKKATECYLAIQGIR